MKKEEKIQRKVQELRDRLLDIYCAVTGDPNGNPDGEGLQIADLPKIAHAVKYRVLPKDSWYIGENMTFADGYETVEKLIEMLRCNCGVNMTWWPPDTDSDSPTPSATGGIRRLPGICYEGA